MRVNGGGATRSPVLSIVLPVYNRAGSIAAAIDSVLVQDFQDWELVLVDDASTDALADAVEAYGDPRIRRVVNPQRLGAAGARNRGLREARGQLFALLDSDDHWLPGTLAARIRFLEKQPDDVFVIVGATLRHYVHTGRIEYRLPSGGDTLEDQLHGCTLSPGATLLGRREAFDIVGEFDASLERLEDWDWLLRYLQHGRVRVFPEPVAQVNVEPRPMLPAVRRAGQRIWHAHAGGLRRRNWTYPLRLASGIRTEEASAAFAEGRRAAAAWRVAWSLCLWPPRFGTTVGRAMRFLRNRTPRNRDGAAPRDETSPSVSSNPS